MMVAVPDPGTGKKKQRSMAMINAPEGVKAGESFTVKVPRSHFSSRLVPGYHAQSQLT